MSDTVTVVDYYYTTVAHQPGEGARVLGALRDAGVNLLAFSGFPEGRRAQLDFVPTDAAAFVAAAKAAKIKLSRPKKALLISGDDRPGAAADLFQRLEAAKISITACDARIGVVAPSGIYVERMLLFRHVTPDLSIQTTDPPPLVDRAVRLQRWQSSIQQ